MTAFFVVASAASLRAAARARRGAPPPAAPPALDRAAIALFHVAAPAALVVDALTWAVLVPMLLRDADPAGAARWRALFFSRSSYFQHGLNAALVAGEMALHAFEPCLVLSLAVVALYASAFAAWSAVFLARFRRPIYPFLAVHVPRAWAAYVGIYAVNVLAVLIVWGLMHGRRVASAARMHRLRAKAE
jgi:hypothetical protein